jgi:hypothetical protein
MGNPLVSAHVSPQTFRRFKSGADNLSRSVSESLCGAGFRGHNRAPVALRVACDGKKCATSGAWMIDAK